MQKGFTLLELLVVIAIIGILSSIVLVSYNGYTAKARLAKTLSWAGSINHSLGDRAVGAWTFDNITGTTVYDDSGNSNNGTAYGGPAVVNGVIGKALSFDGVDDWVKVNALLPDFPDGQNSTFAMWVKFNNVTADMRWFSFQLGADRLRIVKQGSGFAADYKPGTGGGKIVNTMLEPVAGRWYYVAVAYELNQLLTIYIDSKKYQGGTLTELDYKTNASLWIGSDLGLISNFNGLIDDVRIFSSALSQAQIQ